MDPAIWVAVIGVVTAGISHYVGRRQRAADADNLITQAMASVQKTYQGIIDDLVAQVAASRRDVLEARDSARKSEALAAQAESNAWSADMRASQMERFLVELRPILQAHVPDADRWLARMDRLASTTRS